MSLRQKIGIKSRISDYNIDEKNFLDRLDEMTEQAIRRPVHRSKSEISAHERDKEDVS
jgi:alcohol dehydrogenase class IV